MKTTWITLGLAAFAFPVALAACGDSTGDGSSSDGSSESTSSSNSTFECCLNGEGYSCPNQAAFDKCGGSAGDVNQCMAECQGDPDCIDGCGDLGSGGPDPSDCDADDAVDCSSSDDDGGDCAGTAIPCDLDLDCCEGLTCEPRQDGQEGGSCQ